MPQLSVSEIYQVALEAGFSPDQAVTWTAIAMAESRGQTGAHNPNGEDSWGLWQINIDPEVRTNPWGDLSDPLVNAQAAYDISRNGTDLRPWTTTHDSNRGTPQDYRTYLDRVEAIAGGARGNHDGVGGYDSPAPERGPRNDAAGDDDGPDGPARLDTDHDGLLDVFERLAGTDIDSADTDRDGLADGFEALRSHTDPLSADTDGDTFSDATEWAAGTDAGRLPGIAAVAGLGPATQNIREGVLDTDRDGLSDLYEQRTGSSAEQADSDQDGLTDSLEIAIGTDAADLDTDHDGLSDGTEIRYGYNPLAADTGADADPEAPDPLDPAWDMATP